MEEKNKAVIGGILFLLLILFIGVGGYIYTFKNNKHKEIINKIDVITDEYKKDKTKEYIYYTDENVISKELQIVYKTPVINLYNTQTNAIANELAQDNEKMISEIKKISTTENTTGNEITFNTDDIYSATYRNYEDYQYNEYISLVITDVYYDCFKGINDYPNIKSYIFDVKNNERISNLDILSKYNITLTDLKEKIKNKLNEEQTVDNEVETIKIEETINNIDDGNYGLYVDNTGNLVIKYIVKSNQMNYNEIMIIN